MPLYEFHCNQCGAEFEVMLRFSEADRRPACPQCQGEQTHKKLSTVASFGALSSGGSSSSCGSQGGFS
jgi:putative FmdB family regulatory protein